jgi:hypothetical protein
MKNENPFSMTRTVCLAALIGLCASGLGAASFSADMHSVEPETTRVYKLYVQDSRYRLEFQEEGHDMFVIVDPDEDVTYVARIGEKMYYQMPCGDMRSLQNDPFQSVEFVKSVGESIVQGEEEVNGYMCEKVLVTVQDQKILTYWTSGDLGFILKIAMYPPKEKVVELVDFRETELDDALFEVPEGYELIEY